jgi:hypothetical protein
VLGWVDRRGGARITTTKFINHGGRFSFSVAGKGTRHASKVTVNSRLTAAVACTRHGKLINRGGHVRTPASDNCYKKNKKTKPTGEPTGEPNPRPSAHAPPRQIRPTLARQVGGEGEGDLNATDPAGPAHLATGEGGGDRSTADPTAPVHLATGEGGGGGTTVDPATPMHQATGEEGGGTLSWIQAAPRAWAPEREEGACRRGSGLPMHLATREGGGACVVVDPAAPARLAT